jgi:hypothetical protein
MRMGCSHSPYSFCVNSASRKPSRGMPQTRFLTLLVSNPPRQAPANSHSQTPAPSSLRLTTRLNESPESMPPLIHHDPSHTFRHSSNEPGGEWTMGSGPTPTAADALLIDYYYTGDIRRWPNKVSVWGDFIQD